MANTKIVGQTDRISSVAYPWFLFKNDVVVNASTAYAVSASAAFDALKAAIIAQLNGANILRIKVIVDTDEVAP